MEPASLVSFLGITILLILTPGSDMALISRATLRKGQLGAFSAMIGINCASLMWTLFAAVGFVAIVTALPLAMDFLLAVGGLYMGYIGIIDLKKGVSLWKGGGNSSAAPDEKETTLDLFKKGFVVNATNPKIGLYYATVLPNFLTGTANKGAYIAGMGITHNVLGFCWFMTFAYLLNNGLKLFGSEGAKAIITMLTGAALLCFSIAALYYVRQ